VTHTLRLTIQRGPESGLVRVGLQMPEMEAGNVWDCSVDVPEGTTIGDAVDQLIRAHHRKVLA
jgi:hypothetical protein